MEKRHRDFSDVNGTIDKQLGKIVASSIKANVDAGGRPKWQKRTHTYAWPILNKTGTMRKTAESTALVFVKQGSWHVDIISGPKYGPYHQYGTTKLPVRAYVLLQSKEIQAMHKVFTDAFLRR